MRNRILIFVFLFTLQSTINSNAQSCFTISPNVYNIPCGSNCTNISFKVPNYKTTEDYTLKTIPYQPFAFITATGTQETNLYDDDQYSDKYPIGFTFCFFGDKYEKIVIGSNCIVTFDTTNANTSNNYSIAASTSIPFTGGTQNSAGSGYIAKASILAPFQDIEPTPTANPADRKIEWRVEGVAPCRRFIVSYYKIPHFLNNTCITFLNTSQIVLHEKTGIIDVFIKDKTLCTASSTNNTSSTGGRAIFGIQNWARDKAVADPAKNNGVWAETNAGYRFQPNGTTNLLQSVVIKKKDGTVVGNGTIGTAANDSVAITYNNYCLAGAGPDTLVVEANYNSCTGVLLDNYTMVDTIYIIKSPADLLATATTTPALCLSNTGSITVNVPTGAGTAPFQYSINGGALQSGNVFSNLGIGNYTIFVKDASGACTSTIIVSIALSNPVSGTATATAPSCAGANNGTATVIATNATAPIEYNINGGAYQSNNIFSGLVAGSYSINIKDANGCIRAVFVTVPVGSGSLTATVTPTPTTCPGATNGSITISNPTGTAPHTYAIGSPATVFGTNNSFSNLASGIYLITFKDNNGCTGAYNINVTNGAGVTASSTIVNTTCTGVNNGTITVNTSNGTAPYQYALNGGANQLTNLFSNLAPGTYSIRVTDNNNCFVVISATVAAGTGFNATNTTTATTCTGVNNGTITVTPSGGVAPYSYALDGGLAQSANNFTGVSAGTHSVLITDNVGCTRTVSISVAAGTGFNATNTTTATTCTGVNNGTITITPSGGVAPYNFALDGGAAQAVNNFTGVSAGTHSVLITDNVGCTRTVSISVAVGAGINATAAFTATSCNAISDGTITITASNGSAPFNYALDGGSPQVSNIFNSVASGAHTIVVNDALGCSKTISVTVPAGVVFTLAQSTTPTTCAAATNGSATITATGANGTLQYAIDGGSNQAANVFNNLAVGTHNVVVTDGAGCTNNISFAIAAGAGITGSAVPTATTCNGASNGQVQLMLNGIAATPLQYQIGAGAYVATNPFTGLTAGNYTFTIKDANGCITPTINAIVAAGPNLTANTVLTNVTCNGLTNGAVVLTNTNGNPIYTYSLNGGTAQSNNTFNNLAAGNYTVALGDGNGCTGTTVFTISQPTALAATATNTAVICNGGSTGIINVTATGGTAPYTFSINGGVTFQAAPTFNVASNNYNISVKDAQGCIATTTTNVTQPAAITVSSTFTNASCNGGADGTITAIATGGIVPLTYSIDGTNFQASNVFNVLPGNFTVTVKDANNCTNTTNVTVGLTSNILLSTHNDTTICEGQSVVLTTQSNALSFAWHPGNTLNDSTLKNPIAKPITTTKYYVLATLGGCSTVDSVTVTVNPAPIPNAGIDTEICFGLTYTLQGSGGTQYTWAPATTLSNANISNPIANTNNTTNYWLLVKDANGCNSLFADTMKLTITPPLQANAGVDTVVVTNQPYQLNSVLVGQNITGLTYQWNPTTGLSNPNIQNPLATIGTATTYRVEITTPGGCKGVDTVTLSVLDGPTIYVPSGFTPNGDGNNDVFRSYPVGIARFDYLRVFNRWGQLVFESKNPLQGWNGNFKGAKAPTGTYIYTVQGLTDKGNLITKKGTLLIVL